MDKLNKSLLDRFYDSAHGYLEVTDVDVKRLREDRSEIRLGDEVAFVATASFRLTQRGVAQLKGWADKLDMQGIDLAVGDELFVIGNDAELRSDKLPIDEDSVTQWLADHYSFTFLLNGSSGAPFRPVGRVRVVVDTDEDGGTELGNAAGAGARSHTRELAIPWIQKLNTATVKDDYIDVDVRIVRHDQQPHPVPVLPETWQFSESYVEIGKSQVIANLVLESSPEVAARLHGKTLRVPLEGGGDDLRFTIKFTERSNAEAQQRPAPNKSTK
jgi:hypothetical protein